MNVNLHGPPALEIDAGGRLLPESRFGELWSAAMDLSSSWRRLDVVGYLGDWCGSAPEDCAERLIGVHHVGIYLGDYDHEDEALAWSAYLAGRQDDGTVISADVGPSYIAPKQYGTQGWYGSVVFPDGVALETFTCKRYGPWSQLSIDQRRALMSHVALEVRAEPDVRHVLESMQAEVSWLEVIAFTEADELGHTYGHLRNNRSSSVVEIVHQAAVGVGAAPATGGETQR